MQRSVKEAILLMEHGDWVPVVTKLMSYQQKHSLYGSLAAIGKKMRGQLGLRFDPLQLKLGSDGIVEVRAVGIAGSFSAGGFFFEVVPKFFPKADSRLSWSASTLLLMQYARKSDLALLKSKHLAIHQHSFVDLLATAFLDSVESALAEQLIQTYRTKAQSLPVLRGRLLLPQQMRTVMTSPHMVQCEFDELDADNVFNRLLKWASQAFASSVRSPTLRRRMLDLSYRFPGAPDQQLAKRGVRFEPPPQYRIWKDALDIAFLLSSGYSHGTQLGAAKGYSFVFNMERLFEHFVELSLERAVKLSPALDLGVHRQASIPYAFPVSGSSVRFHTRPDNVLTRGGKAILVIDAKYKRLFDRESIKRSKPVNADVYELIAAMTAHGCHNGLLVYPSLPGDVYLSGDALHTWAVSSFGQKLTISTLAIDIARLRDRSDLGEIDLMLSSNIGQIISGW